MRKKIDLYWFDARGKCIRQDKKVPPWRVRVCRKAFGVVECESGQSLVEFALLLPVLILLIFGFLQFSLALQASLQLQHVTFYATTVGSLTNDDQKITGAIESFYEPGEVEITLENRSHLSGGSIQSGDRRYGDELSLRLVHLYPIQIPYLTITHLDLESVASTRILCQADRFPFTCE